MSKNKHKHQAPSTKAVELNNTPDIDSDEAITQLVNEIVDEAIKIEEGRTQTVFPLCKLAKQYKELSSKSVE